MAELSRSQLKALLETGDILTEDTLGSLVDSNFNLTDQGVMAPQSAPSTVLPGITLNWVRVGPIYSFWTTGTLTSAVTPADGTVLWSAADVPPLALYQGTDAFNLSAVIPDWILFNVSWSSGGVTYDSSISGEVTYSAGQSVAIKAVLLLGSPT